MGAMVDPTQTKLTPKAAVAGLTQAGKALYNEIKELCDKHFSKELDSYWEIGNKMAEAMRESRGDDKKYCKYGTGLVLTMSIALGLTSESVLRNAVDIVKAWPDKADFQQMQKLRGELDNRLRLTHLIHLSRINDDGARWVKATEALDACYDPQELLAVIHKTHPSGKVGPKGRTPKIPTTAMGCVIAMETQAHKFVNAFDRSWTGEAFDLPKKVEAVPVDKLGEGLLKAIDDAETKLAELKKRATSCVKLLESVKIDINQRLKTLASTSAADSEDENMVNLGKVKNAEARERRAETRARKAAAQQRKGRVGTKRHS
jgi:hypothetical protein